MKQNQKNRYNGRYNNRNNRSVITRNTSLESSGPCGKLHGTALQLFEKYQSAAKDALIQNDVVLAEICLQHADHYIRMQNIAIANEQANRPQQPQQQKQPEAPADELPTITVEIAPEKPAEQSTTEAMAEPVIDDAITKMDLSVPVGAMQEQNQSIPQKRTLRPRQPKQKVETAPVTDTTPTA